MINCCQTAGNDEYYTIKRNKNTSVTLLNESVDQKMAGWNAFSLWLTQNNAPKGSYFNPLRPRYPSPDYPLSIQRKWLPKMKMHTCHSNLQFIVTSSLFAMKLSINVAHVSNYSPDIFNLEQSNTVSRKKILFTAITVIFQQVYKRVLPTAVLKIS